MITFDKLIIMTLIDIDLCLISLCLFVTSFYLKPLTRPKHMHTNILTREWRPRSVLKPLYTRK